MIADVVTVFGDRLDVVGELIDPLLDEEEGTFDLVFIENIEQGVCLLVAPCRVKGDGADLLGGINIVDRDLPRFSRGVDRLARCLGGDRDRRDADQHTGEQDYQLFLCQYHKRHTITDIWYDKMIENIPQ